MSTTRWFDGLRWMTLLGVMMWTASSIAQEAANRAEPPSPGPLSNPVSDSVRELREQIRELQAAVAGMRSDWQRAREETAELRRELDEIRTQEVRAETTPRNAVVRDTVAKSEISNSEGAARLQDSLRNVLQSGAPQDDEQVPKEDQQKGGACRQPGRGISTAEWESGRSVSDESGKRIEVPVAPVGHRFDEPGEQSGYGG